MKKNTDIKINFKQLCRIAILLFPIVLIILISFVFQDKIIIESISPEYGIAGIPFNEFNGEAALAVKGNEFMIGDIIYINGIPQNTTYGNNEILTCIVDSNLYQKQATLKVKVIRKEGNRVLLKSNEKILEIIENMDK